MKKGLLNLCIVSFLVCFVFSTAEAKRVAVLSIGKGEATVSFLSGSAEVSEKGMWSRLDIGDTLGKEITSAPGQARGSSSCFRTRAVFVLPGTASSR
jgi:hypothetical protein